MAKERHLLTGISGQDASILARKLLTLGCEVYGMKRRNSSNDLGNAEDIKNQITIVEGDLLDQTSLSTIIKEIKPDYCYNFAAQSFVGLSFTQPELTTNVDALGTLRILESIRQVSPSTRFYQAGSSEQFGKVVETPQNENTPFHPQSPYGCAKLYAHWITKNYRDSYKMFACSAILFNHSSIYRGKQFFTRKLTNTAARIKLGLEDKIVVGNLKAKRDEGAASDYMDAVYLMMRQDQPDDFVISTGETVSMEDMALFVFDYLGLNFNKYVKIDPVLYRPNEVDLLLGDSTKARKILGWKPKYDWKMLLEEMVENDLKLERLNIK